jgi:hypothetical protein
MLSEVYMIEFIKSMVSGPEGEISSKRIMAALLIISGLVYQYIFKDSVGTGVMIGAGTALLTTGAITKS